HASARRRTRAVGMSARRLRADLPFGRIALVLSGGGALGAYEVGVLKVLEALELAPALVSGISIGAVNAVIWLAHGRRTAPLERTWRNLHGGDIGLRWLALALRAAGAFGAGLALLELLLALTGSRELSGAYWFWRKGSARVDLASAQMDLVSWLVLAALCLTLVFTARRIDAWLAGRATLGDPARGRRLLGRITLGLAAIHALVWATGWPWPHRFSASVVIVLALIWLGSGGGSFARALRRVGFRLLPETGGRGLWDGEARRRVLERLVGEGDPSRLVGPGSGLAIGALALDRGRMTHFISWPDPDPGFVERVRAELGDVVVLRTPDEVVRAATASSAIPGVFEPERIDGRDFVDGGGFSNQPLHLALARDADAIVVVLLTPSGSPTASPPPADLVALAGRLLELANWRDLQSELRQLPAEWSRERDPSRVCVVEPDRPLPGSVLNFDPAQAAALIALGEQDAWRALARAGWLVPAHASA
ncbi:MAG TPA: patatin-like phospholipase family protein, partial [Candidatus Acidoferrales bacterium]|nr:patatin-like phospholipase family protein [Candidatus Acidoferrales bacterium]